ncbi:hypothetical protein NM688_g5773 [Phlebia brevispora]|uniref:Uncharacterized protein n=1 Tax=Phlebia brevispora TaxID=194682 RepID=A0ACC1SQ73_9APHY|nr:hypothetical protein NM688_g5773 [Phlebia brevispora]
MHKRLNPGIQHFCSLGKPPNRLGAHRALILQMRRLRRGTGTPTPLPPVSAFPGEPLLLRGGFSEVVGPALTSRDALTETRGAGGERIFCSPVICDREEESIPTLRGPKLVLFPESLTAKNIGPVERNPLVVKLEYDTQRYTVSCSRENGIQSDQKSSYIHAISYTAPQEDTMHRCLAIEEILRAIFAYARSNGASLFEAASQANHGGPFSMADLHTLDFKTVLALALTCRTFQEPALDQLWKEQWGFKNLISLMPDDLWVLSTSGGRRLGQMDFVREPVASDWTRFDYYIDRVKRFDVVPFGGHFRVILPVPSGRIFSAFRARAKTSILPNLTSLHWSTGITPAGCANDFHIFLPSSVSSFTLDIMPEPNLQANQPAPDEYLNLSQVPVLCPSLTEFSISGYEVSARLVAQIATVLSSLRNLVSFSMLSHTSFPHDAIAALGTLPLLQHLAITVQSNQNHPDNPLLDRSVCSTPRATFASLKDLELTAESPLSCAHALKIMSLPTLQRLTISVMSARMLRSILEEVAASCSPQVLQELRISDTSYGEFDMPEPNFHAIDDLKLLKEFRNLSLLRISCPLKLKDVDMESIPSWWPALESLSLGQCGWEAPKITLSGLAALAGGCPNLNNLDLAFDASQPKNFADPQFCNIKLVRLCVADSPRAGKPADVANKLAAIFPNLEIINTSRITDSWEGYWDEVECSLRHLTS